MSKRIFVQDLMSEPALMLSSGASTSDARELMGDAGIRHVPVIDAEGHLVGIVSDRDLRRAPSGISRVSDIMTRTVIRVHPWTPAHEAAAELIGCKIGSLPVVDGAGRLVGIITETDFLAIAHEALAGIGFTDRAQA